MRELTSPVIDRVKNKLTYPAADGGQKIVGFSLKLLRCRARAFFCSYGTGNGGHFNNAHVCTHAHHPSARADSEAAGGQAAA